MHHALVGRPVLMAGTAPSAATNAASGMAASALMPARSSSLFLAGLASRAERCLRSSSTVYSAFGMVKLSRTSFGFFALTGFAALGLGVALADAFPGSFPDGLVDGLLVDLAGDLAGDLATGLGAALTGTVATNVVFPAAGLMVGNFVFFAAEGFLAGVGNAGITVVSALGSDVMIMETFL